MIGDFSISIRGVVEARDVTNPPARDLREETTEGKVGAGWALRILVRREGAARLGETL
jgi:hypothetical protein